MLIQVLPRVFPHFGKSHFWRQCCLWYLNCPYNTVLNSAFVGIIFLLQLQTAVIMFSGAVVPKHLHICIHAILYIMFLLFLLYITVGTLYWPLKMREVMGYKGSIIKYLLHRKEVLSLTDRRMLVLEQHGTDICLLNFHSFFHSTNVYLSISWE